MGKKTITGIDQELDRLWTKERQLSEKEADYSQTLYRLSEQEEELGYYQGVLSNRLMELADRYPSSFYEFEAIEGDTRHHTSNIIAIYNDEISAIKKEKQKTMDEMDAVYHQKLALNHLRQDILEQERRRKV